MPGIGVQTVGLAHVKQSLYVSGIGSQIDSGAWDKLEPEKRLDGYDHSFLWSRPESLFYGRFWSSQDRRGRAKYPMVLCVESFDATPGVLVGLAGTELDQLKTACQQASTADEVTEACRASQARLDQSSLQTRGSETAATSQELRKSFLDNPQLGPGRLGLLRVLHEITRALGMGSHARSVHLRVPHCAGTEAQGELLWLEFLRTCLPAQVPMLLLARSGAGFVDVLLGEVGDGEFFCMQASPKALPLASEIPYEIEPELEVRLNQIEARFLGGPPGSTSEVKPSTPSPKPPSTDLPETARPAQHHRGSSRPWIFGGIGVLVLATGVGLLLLRQPGPGPLSNPSIATTSPTNKAPAPVLPVQPVSSQDQEDLKRALDAARFAFDRGDLKSAIELAERALVIEPNHPEARRLKSDAQDKLKDAELLAATEKKYQDAMETGRTAYSRGQWQETVDKADEALKLKPNDAAAGKLKSGAQGKIEEAKTLAASEKKYQDAMETGRTAYSRGQWQETVDKADEALKLKPNDPAAGKLKTDARGKIEEAASLTEARNDFTQGLYGQALAICARYAGVSAFEQLKVQAMEEQRVLQGFQERLDKADYAWTNELAGLGYGRKDPYQALWKEAVAEAGQLSALEECRRQTNWSELLNRAAGLSPATRAKPPFARLIEWAQPWADQERAGTKLKDLDTRLQILLVRFSVLKPTDKRVTTPEAQRLKPWPPRSVPLDQRQEILEGLEAIEAGYQTGGWINQEGRQAFIEELKDRIPRW